jgi:hypothetical protein
MLTYRVTFNVSGEIRTFWTHASSIRAAYHQAIKRASDKYDMSITRMLNFNHSIEEATERRCQDRIEG